MCVRPSRPLSKAAAQSLHVSHWRATKLPFPIGLSRQKVAATLGLLISALVERHEGSLTQQAQLGAPMRAHFYANHPIAPKEPPPNNGPPKQSLGPSLAPPSLSVLAKMRAALDWRPLASRRQVAATPIDELPSSSLARRQASRLIPAATT